MSGTGLKLQRGQSGRGLLSEDRGKWKSPHADWNEERSGQREPRGGPDEQQGGLVVVVGSGRGGEQQGSERNRR